MRELTKKEFTMPIYELGDMFDFDGNLNPCWDNFQSVSCTFKDGLRIAFIGDAQMCKTVVVSGELSSNGYCTMVSASKTCEFPWVNESTLKVYFNAHHADEWWKN